MEDAKFCFLLTRTFDACPQWGPDVRDWKGLPSLVNASFTEDVRVDEQALCEHSKEPLLRRKRYLCTRANATFHVMGVPIASVPAADSSAWRARQKDS